MGPLRNPRHEAFARALFEGKSASAAYAEAGYSNSRGNASRMKANESIQMRVVELQAAAQRNSEVTIKSLLAELEDARQRATDLKQLSASVRAIESKARISGLLVERHEVKNVYERYENVTSIEELAQLEAEGYREQGYHLNAEDTEDLGRLMAAWWEATQAILDASRARSVPSAMSAEEIERHERKRLGLASPLNYSYNGTKPARVPR
jgi:hypothetical protein